MHATLFTDSACPWGYSANPDLTVLRWRYGSGITWKVQMIGLAETPDRYVDAGYTPEMMAAGYETFGRRFGMPFGDGVRSRVIATGRACRANVAVRRLQPELEWAAVRALQFAWFTTTTLLDEDDAIGDALSAVQGLDVDAVMAQLDDPENEAAYQHDRAHARTAAGGATSFQGKSANSDGADRFTAPSVLFQASNGQTLEAGGFQNLAVYDACIANLDRTLERRDAAGSAAEVLAAFPHGVTTQEVAAVMTSGLNEVDRAGARSELESLVADGKARRTTLGDDALWFAA